MLFFQGYLWLQFKNKTEKPCSGISLWKVILLYLLTVCVCACCAPAMEREWRSESSLRESLSSFHYVGSGEHIQVIKLRGKFLFSTETSDRHLWKKTEGFMYKRIRILSYKALVSSQKNFKDSEWMLFINNSFSVNNLLGEKGQAMKTLY